MPSYRSQSRSPAVGSSSVSQTPPFQPPSFYAAAANDSSTSQAFSRQANDRQNYAYTNTFRASPGVPLSYPTQHEPIPTPARGHVPERDPSQGPSDYAQGSSRTRSSSLSRSLSRTKSGRGDREKGDWKEQNEKANLRSSQFVDIPFLEMQLLPSLRDTIDRMTHPPTPGTKYANESYVSHSHPDDARPDQKRSPSIPQSPPHHSDLALANTGREDGDQAPRYQPYEGRSAAPTGQISSTTSVQNQSGNSRSTPKTSSPMPPTKSALRTPVVSSRAVAPSPASDSHSMLPNQSLRTTRSMVPDASDAPRSARNTPSTRQMEYAQVQSPRIQDNQTALPDSSRVATERRSKGYTRSNPTTPKPTLKSPTFAPPYPSLMVPQSGPSSRSGIPRPSYAVTTTGNDSGSDLARRYEKTITGGRLMVTNASAVPTSSDSEDADYERERRRRPSRGPNKSPQPYTYTDRPHELDTRSPHYHAAYSPRDRSPRLSSNQHLYAGAIPDRRMGLGLQFDDHRHAHFGETSEDERSLYEDEFGGYEGTYDSQDDSEDFNHAEHHSDRVQRDRRDSRSDRRRQDALAGIVNGLGENFSLYPARSGQSRLSQGESEYNISGVGLAIGDARDLQRNSKSVSAGVAREEVQRGSSQRQEATHSDGRNDYKAVVGEPYSSSGRSRDRRRDQEREDVYRDARHTNKGYRRSSSLPPVVNPSSGNNTSRAQPVPSNSQPQASPGTVYHGHSGHTDGNTSKKSRHRVSASMGKVSHSDVNRRPAGEANLHLSKQLRGGDYAEDIPTNQERQAEAAAMREREGFGIPTSLSFHGNEKQDDDQRRESRHLHVSYTGHLPHAESNLSTIAGKSWEEQTAGEQLSNGAEALFRKLSIGTTSTDEQRSRRHRRRGMTIDNAAPTPSEQAVQVRDPRSTHMRHSRSFSEASSVPSVYEEQPTPPQDYEQFPTCEPNCSEVDEWRSTIGHEVYGALLAIHGPQEMLRQNALYQFFSEEDTFVSQLRMILRQFIRPLRHRDSKEWLPGVPTPVTRLFDWFDDIINLHLGMAIAMKAARRNWRTGDLIVKAAEILVSFIPRLEIYQPYLVRVEPVTKLILQCTSDGKSELGEFVKIREQDPECGGWNLIQLLREPVKHLSTYPETFLRIWKLTPRDHPDHLPMLSLFHSTQMMLRVMLEVQKREEAYELVKEVTSNIEGLSSSAQLASRERHLLWHGPVTVRRIQDRNHVHPSALSTQQQKGSNRSNIPKIVIGHAPDSRMDQEHVILPEGPIQVQAFILSDVIMLTVPVPVNKSRHRERKRWRLLETTGVARLLGMKEKASTSGDTEVVLDLLPLSAVELQTGVITESIAVIALQMYLRHGSQQDKTITALRRCHAYTLRSLSFPSHTGQYLQHGPQVDLELDTQQSVAMIMSSGLPMPKSPSMQMQEAQRGQATGAVEQEREERGWWSLRFQQVLREMQRREPVLSLNLTTPALGSTAS